MRGTKRHSRNKVFLNLCKCSVITFIAVFLLSTPGYTKPDKTFINIPPQEAGKALETLAVKMDISLFFFSDEIENVILNPIKGNYSCFEALEVMLKNTGLIFKQTGDGSVIIKKETENKQKGEKPQPPLSLNDTPVKQLPTGGQPQIDQDVNTSPEESYNDYMLEDTVVTANKREMKIQSVPMSIQALKGENLEKIGAAGIEDFVHKVPGLTFNVGGNGFGVMQIRGISPITNGPTATATVGYYIDDTPISNAMQVPDMGLFDIERIEVLKGPQGTLYGEGSLGGTVRLITRQPQMNAFESKVQLAGSKTKNSPDLSYKTNVMVNTPLVNDNLALRLSGSFNDDSGFVTDANSGAEGVNKFTKSYLRGALRFEPQGSDDFVITPSFIYQKLDGASPAYDSPNYPDLTWYRQLPFSEDLEDENVLYSLGVEYDFGWSKLSSSTSYYDRDLSMVQDASLTNDSWLKPFLSGAFGVNVPYVITYGDSQVETFIQEFRLASNAKGPFSWLVGSFYRDRENRDIWNVPNDQLLATTGNETVFAFDVKQESKQIAVFGDVNYNILENLKLTGGLRWFEEKIKGNAIYKQIFINPMNPFELVSGTVNTEITENDLLYKLAASYNPVDNLMVYTQFTQGVRPGGTNERAVNFGYGTLVDPTFRSDSTNNYEAGIKSDWFNGQFRANLSAYYIDWQDIQVTDLTELFQPFVVNAAEAVSTGCELELLASPARGVTLGLNMNYSFEAEITKETTTSAGTIPKGAPLPFTPEYSGNLFADYTFPINHTDYNDLAASVGIDLQFMGEMFVETQTGVADPKKLASYQTLNFRMGVGTDDWNVSLSLTNVMDERAELDYYPYENFGYFRNRPRTVSLSYTINF